MRQQGSPEKLNEMNESTPTATGSYEPSFKLLPAELARERDEAERQLRLAALDESGGEGDT
jgi:hypothetical protein